MFIHYECSFRLSQEKQHSSWIRNSIQSEKKSVRELNFIFCNDEYLLKKNQEFLNHDTLTDIITFDYSENQAISGDIFISVQRVKENAITFAEPFDVEMRRIMIHGVLHLVGYKDKSMEDKRIMTEKENFYIKQYTN